jgi:hypothetical protein
MISTGLIQGIWSSVLRVEACLPRQVLGVEVRALRLVGAGFKNAFGEISESARCDIRICWDLFRESVEAVL